MKEILIPINKLKTVLLFSGSALFTFLCYWMVKDYTFNDLPLKTISGNFKLFFLYFGLLFFCLLGIAIFLKLFSSYSIKITQKSIIDNSGGFVSKEIMFKDINNIDIYEYNNQKFIIVYVNNPNDYIKNQKNIFERFLIKMNNRLYSSPFFINKHVIKYDINDLVTLLNNKLDEFNKQA